MSKTKKADFKKIQEIVLKYPKEFTCTPLKTLWCGLCQKSVSYTRKSLIDSHRSSSLHASRIKTQSLQQSETLIMKPFLK